FAVPRLLAALGAFKKIASSAVRCVLMCNVLFNVRCQVLFGVWFMVHFVVLVGRRLDVLMMEFSRVPSGGRGERRDQRPDVRRRPFDYTDARALSTRKPAVRAFGLGYASGFNCRPS